MTSKVFENHLKTTSAKTLASATNVPEILLSTSILDVLNLLETDGRSCVLVRDVRNIPGNKALSGDIIFTRCAGPCVKMTRQMKELQDALASSSAVHLVSLTTDPTFDTPAVLHQYSQRFTADSSRWSFLTGTPSQIASLAAGSLKLTALEKAPKDRETPEDLFIHSTIFVLVDRHSRLRGVFETTGDDIDPAAIKAKILGAVHTLEKEL